MSNRNMQYDFSLSPSLSHQLNHLAQKWILISHDITNFFEPRKAVALNVDVLKHTAAVWVEIFDFEDAGTPRTPPLSSLHCEALQLHLLVVPKHMASQWLTCYPMCPF